MIDTVRIFVSSTFSDMHSERDYLADIVFPELAQRCRRLGIALVEVDLRWGVTDEEVETGKVIDICLDEIDKCRPFFIGILGERYGWIPEFRDSDSLGITQFPRSLLGKGHSMTALEVFYGVLGNKEQIPNSFFYFRDPSVIECIPNSKREEFASSSLIELGKIASLKQAIVDHYAKYPGNINTYSALYSGLKVQWGLIREDALSRFTVSEYTQLEAVCIKDNLVDQAEFDELPDKSKQYIMQKSTVRLGGLEKFGESVLNQLWRAILTRQGLALVENMSGIGESALHRLHFAQQADSFIGRIDALEATLHQLESGPCVITGKPGIGKTAFISKLSSSWKSKYPNSLVIERQSGISRESRISFHLATSICTEIEQYLSIQKNDEQLTDSRKICARFSAAISHPHWNTVKLGIFVDAIDDLDNSGENGPLAWLPWSIPETLTFAMSVNSDSFERLSLKTRNWIDFELSEFSTTERLTMLKNWLWKYRKKLPQAQSIQISEKLGAGSPLYLAMAVETLRLFPDYSLIKALIDDLPEDWEGLTNYILAQRIEPDFGQNLVSNALGFASLAKEGLSSQEMIDLLNTGSNLVVTPLRWATIERALRAFLTNGDNGEPIRISHRKIRSIIQSRYSAQMSSLRKRMIDYFDEKDTVYFFERFMELYHDSLGPEVFHRDYFRRFLLMRLCSTQIDAIHGFWYSLISRNSFLKTEIKDYLKADLQLRSHKPDMRIKTARILALNGFYEAALDLLDYKTVKKFHGERWRLYANRGYWQSSIHKPDKAIRSFKRAINLAKKEREGRMREYAGLLNGLGYQYSKKHQYESALPYLLKSLEIRSKLAEGKSDSANSLNAIGYAYKMTGRISQAKDCYNAALNIRQETYGNNNPIVAESYNSIASILQIEGNIQGAIESMANAVAVLERFVQPDDERLLTFKQRLASYSASSVSTKATK